MKEWNIIKRLDRKTAIALGAGVAAAFAATVLFAVFQTIVAPERPSAVEVELRVVKSLREIPEGSAVTREMLGYTTLPADKAGEDLIVDPDQVLGLKVHHTIASGSVLKKSDVVNPVSPGIPEGKVAMSLRVDTVSGVTWMINAGDAVDVVGVLRPVVASDKRGKVATVMLQALRVFAVEAPVAKKGKQAGVTEKGTVTLLMTPKEAQTLTLLAAAGEYTLTLRGKGDDEVRKALPVVSVRDLVSTRTTPSKKRSVAYRSAPRLSIVEVK